MNPRQLFMQLKSQLKAPLICVAYAGLTAALTCATHDANAQTLARITGNASIATGAAVGATGAITVNEAAGLNNAQANQLTMSTGGSVANDNASVQSASASAKVTSARASIDGNAFSNTSGAVLVNQSAGAGNLQRNSVQLGTAAIGAETVSDSVLSAAVPKNGGLARPNGVHDAREATLSNEAFKNVNGIVQINQTAGAGNATANSFVLRPPAGTLF
ncbi:hypothetical protein [Paraburkholderia rhizosphaerae]|uniref:Adhesin HecA-like repeat protein n=1 Tax=Paraburkholderia rhizosphaerae TaxID=480658 RepID=A0A4R8LNG0_9BURK|nr:hypothetical protein [Paraburkholderia rhizosphaerae]TDY47802.1 hypothetical protein BX592_112195 [Paraburkholderia rhizosphaerae]